MSASEITSLASKADLELEIGHEKEYGVLMSTLEDCIAQLGEDKDLKPRPDLSKYPGTDVQVPEDTEGGGWDVKAAIKATSPTGDLAKSKTIAPKGNVSVSGSSAPMV